MLKKRSVTNSSILHNIHVLNNCLKIPEENAMRNTKLKHSKIIFMLNFRFKVVNWIRASPKRIRVFIVKLNTKYVLCNT